MATDGDHYRKPQWIKIHNHGASPNESIYKTFPHLKLRELWWRGVGIIVRAKDLEASSRILSLVMSEANSHKHDC